MGTTLPEFWSEVFPAAYGNDFAAPPSRASTAPRRTARGVENRDLGYCTDDTTVYLDETDLAALAYGEIGDFALATAMSHPTRWQSATRPVRRRRGGHPFGRLPDRLVRGPVVQRRLHRLHAAPRSAQDIDEAVQFLLEYGVRPVFPNTSASGFELVGAFRTGFLQGGDACDLGR